MGTAPNGWQAPKTNWTTEDPVGNGDLNRIEGNIEAIDLGNRTIDDAQEPSSDTGHLRQLLDWIANRLKAITGKTNWFDAPAASIETMIAKFSALSLTNYDSFAVPQIAAGSRVLVKDTPIYFSSNTSITGTPTTNSINYITVSIAGVPAWTDTAPVWKDAYQQYMDAGETLRYVGGCYYKETNYAHKFLFDKGRDADREFEIEIGDWNMDEISSISRAHNLSIDTIRSVEAIIRNDTGNVGQSLVNLDSAYVACGRIYWSPDAIYLNRRGGGHFDSTSYDSTSYNRGWITVKWAVI